MEKCIMCSEKKHDMEICYGCNCFTCNNCKTIVHSIILCLMCHYNYEKAVLRD